MKVEMKAMHHPVKEGRSWSVLFSSFRVQLLLCLSVGVILPAMLYVPGDLFAAAQSQAAKNTSIAAAIATFVGVLAVRKMGEFPGTITASYIFPALACSYSLVMLLTLLLRAPYSGALLSLSFLLVLGDRGVPLIVCIGLRSSDPHRAELQHAKRPPPETDPFLPEKDRPGGIKSDEQRSYRQWDQQQRKCDKRYRNIDCPFHLPIGIARNQRPQAVFRQMFDTDLAGTRLPNLFVMIDADAVERGDRKGPLPFRGVIVPEVGHDDRMVGFSRQRRRLKHLIGNADVTANAVDLTTRNEIIEIAIAPPLDGIDRKAHSQDEQKG